MEKGETIKTIISLVELDNVQKQDAMNCLDQHPQAEKVPLGCSTKGNPHHMSAEAGKQGVEGAKLDKQSSPLPLQYSCPFVCAYMFKRSQVM